jgi:hypothetical protein
MNTYWRQDEFGNMYELEAGVLRRSMGLLGQGESIDALIDRAIAQLPDDKQAFVMEVSAQDDVLTLAVGSRFKNGWRVMLGADIRKDGVKAGRVELIKEFK